MKVSFRWVLLSLYLVITKCVALNFTQIDSVDSEGMQLLYDGIDITQNVTDVNDTFSGDGVEIIRTDADSVLSAFSNGLAISISLSLLGMLNIVVNLPVEYNSLTQGLMGNFNGNSSDDFIFSNGTMLDDGASDSVIHSFGQSCKFKTCAIEINIGRVYDISCSTHII